MGSNFHLNLTVNPALNLALNPSGRKRHSKLLQIKYILYELYLSKLWVEIDESGLISSSFNIQFNRLEGTLKDKTRCRLSKEKGRWFYPSAVTTLRNDCGEGFQYREVTALERT